MRDLFLRFCRWALPFFGVSAFVSCDNVFNTPDMYGSPVVEYGTPVMEYVVKGKVTDTGSGEPIEGIQVTADDGDKPVLTTATGDFECRGSGEPDGKVKLIFTDIDGTLNNGYDPLEIGVPVEKVADGSGAWHFGYYIAEGVMVKLDPYFINYPVVAEYGVPPEEFHPIEELSAGDK